LLCCYLPSAALILAFNALTRAGVYRAFMATRSASICFGVKFMLSMYTFIFTLINLVNTDTDCNSGKVL